MTHHAAASYPALDFVLPAAEELCVRVDKLAPLCREEDLLEVLLRADGFESVSICRSRSGGAAYAVAAFPDAMRARRPRWVRCTARSGWGRSSGSGTSNNQNDKTFQP